MTRNQKDFTPDASFQFKDAGLVAADGAAQVGGSDQIIDLGASRVDGRVIIDISAIEAATDERYDIHVQLSNSATFASGIHSAAVLPTGLAAAIPGDTTTAVGRYELPFCNEMNGVTYRYARVYTDVTGTIATGINYTAWGAIQPG